MPDEVAFSNLDQTLLGDDGPTKGDLIHYLRAVSGRLVPELTDRPLSVVRVTRGQAPFMQKNLPKHAPDWIERAPIWSAASNRTVTYPLCNDERTLLWLGNQRAVEFHPSLVTVAGGWESVDRLVIDLDPPADAGFGPAAAVAHIVGSVLDALGLTGALKTSGAKGVHIVVPVEPLPADDAAAATRAIAARTAALDPAIATTEFIKDDRGGKVFVDATRAGSATVVAAYSPRVRPGLPVSFPLAWPELDTVHPSELTITTAVERLGEADPWADALAGRRPLPEELVTEGRAIPAGRVAAMHEGRRRARARRAANDGDAGTA